VRAAQQAEQQSDDEQSDESEQPPAGDDMQLDEPTMVASAQVRAVVQAGAVLEELLTDVWADEDVISAFDRLQPAAVPTYAQLSEQSAQQGQQQQQQLWQQQQQQQHKAGGQQQHKAGGQDTLQLQPAHSRVAADPQGVKVGAAVGTQQFHAFAEYVLDNALLGTLQEGRVAGTAADDEA
jgi:hypothetical protein